MSGSVRGRPRRTKLYSSAKAEKSVKLFTALSSPVRHKLLLFIYNKGEPCRMKDLAKALSLEEGLTSRHLKYLVNSKILIRLRFGAYYLYDINIVNFRLVVYFLKNVDFKS